MEVFEKTSKNQDSLLNELLTENNLEEKEIIYKITESKTGLFKTINYNIKAVKLADITDFIKNYLNELINKMGLEVSFETKINNNQIYIKMFSNNNNILIGKNGQTLNALQLILRQVITNEINLLPYIILDVENYKDKQVKNIERLAINIAKEVNKTGIDTSLENMNSYERRIVHNKLANFEGIITTSEGEEPNRHVVIKKVN